MLQAQRTSYKHMKNQFSLLQSLNNPQYVELKNMLIKEFAKATGLDESVFEQKYEEIENKKLEEFNSVNNSDKTNNDIIKEGDSVIKG